MKQMPTKAIGSIANALILSGFILTSPFQAQELKFKRHLFIGAGIGACEVASRELGRTVNAFGPSFSATVGLHLSERNSLQLEFIFNRPTDEKPMTSDLKVTTEIHNGNKHYSYELIRSPKVLQTQFLFLSICRSVFQDFFCRIGLGFGSNYFADYRVSGGVVQTAGLGREIAYGIGIAGGYERQISGRLALALEASVRWSSGEDSTSARFVFGLGTVVKWDF